MRPLLAELFSVCSRRAAAEFFEDPVEMAEILKAGRIGGLLDGHRVIGQKIAGFLESCLDQIVFWRAVEVQGIIFVKLAFSYI